MGIAILGILFLALAFGPIIWVKRVMAKHADERADYPGTGGELARHLLDEAGLHDVPVEEAEADHYDPNAKAVRLSPDNLNGRSVTAVAVAAHEVGHAIQHQEGYAPLEARGRIVLVAHRFDQIAMVAIAGMSLIGSAAISPKIMLFGGLVIVAAGLVRVIANLVTLPVEFDASFNRALPKLAEGYIPEDDAPAARQVLRAAAFTYVAAAIVSALNVLRFIRWLR